MGRLSRLPLANQAAHRVLGRAQQLQDGPIVRACKAFEPDIVLVLLGSQVHPGLVQKIRSALPSAHLACWCQDQMTTLGRQYVLGAPYDRIYFKCRHLADTFSRFAGTNCAHLPEACNPNIHFPEAPTTAERHELQAQVMTYGNLYYYRYRLMQPIVDEFDLKFWGTVPRWLKHDLPDANIAGRGIFGPEKRKAIGASDIVLNSMHFAEIASLNARLFEVAGCGGFQLVSGSAEISRYFKNEEHLVTFDSQDDMMDKIRWYIDRPADRERIAKQGCAEVRSRHTYTHRLATILAGREQ